MANYIHRHRDGDVLGDFSQDISWSNRDRYHKAELAEMRRLTTMIGMCEVHYKQRSRY